MHGCCIGLRDIVPNVMLWCPSPIVSGRRCTSSWKELFSGSEWSRDRGSEYTTGCHAVLLCNLASSASPPHRAPIRSFPHRWNDSSNPPSLLWGGGGSWSNYTPPPPKHTHWHRCRRAWTKLSLLYRLAPPASFLLSPAVNRQPWPFIQAIMACDRSHSSLAVSCPAWDALFSVRIHEMPLAIWKENVLIH